MADKIICPYCGTPNIPERRRCNRCSTPLDGSAYANDYIRLRELTFLVEETVAWPGAGPLREPYLQQLDDVRRRAFPHLAPATSAAPAPASEPPEEAQHPAVAPAAVSPPPAPAPARPPDAPVPFEQWLLSERNIKLALYAGALLLLIAGAIFVGVSWNYLPGPAKFAITVLCTGLLYLCGFLLYQRPSMRAARMMRE